MTVELLSRLQFALTISFHYIFPPFSIGLGLIIVIIEGQYLRTRNMLYRQLAHFWIKIFGLIFVLGVASGIVMEFQFGTNWSNFSRFVGDVFGSPLAAEGIFAFFLESSFLAILLFGRDKVKPGVHFFSTLMVALGAHLSAVWIIAANSWMQTPAGYRIAEQGGAIRAEVANFSDMLFNPSTLDRLMHTLLGAWQAGVWLVISVSAYYLLRNKHQDFARVSLKIALPVALAAALGQLVSGDSSANLVAEHQPAKLAAMEGHYSAWAPADMYLFGWVNERQERVQFGLALPGMLSWLLTGNRRAPVTGLRAFPPEDRPPVNITFQAYHLMVALGMLLIGISILSVYYMLRNRLYLKRQLLWLMVFAVLAPQIANQAGWMTAEVGRQPWIVYGLMRTAEGISPTLSVGQILFSLIGFSLIYILLFTMFLYLLGQKIKQGPAEEPIIRGEEGI